MDQPFFLSILLGFANSTSGGGSLSAGSSISSKGSRGPGAVRATRLPFAPYCPMCWQYQNKPLYSCLNRCIMFVWERCATQDVRRSTVERSGRLGVRGWQAERATHMRPQALTRPLRDNNSFWQAPTLAKVVTESTCERGCPNRKTLTPPFQRQINTFWLNKNGQL